jgi:demethylmenaquinone methyltransferase / 2-methoxy-6-polyprenyl-1,4-benzoquinol methylase
VAGTQGMAVPVVADGSGTMFDAIAPGYDRLNRVLSFGLDKSWRRAAIDALAVAPEHYVLDVATGTADVAIVAGKRGACVLGIDPSVQMIAIGRDKVEAEGLSELVDLMVGDAESLPFEDQRFDRVTMAFGIRNVHDRPRALREIRRVMKAGGKLSVLELNEPRDGVLGKAAQFHLRKIVPVLGAMLSSRSAYKYLNESVVAFPAPEAFGRMMEDAGLNVEIIRPLTFGACVLYVASRPEDPRVPGRSRSANR